MLPINAHQYLNFLFCACVLDRSCDPAGRRVFSSEEGLVRVQRNTAVRDYLPKKQPVSLWQEEVSWDSKVKLSISSSSGHILALPWSIKKLKMAAQQLPIRFQEHLQVRIWSAMGHEPEFVRKFETLCRSGSDAQVVTCDNLVFVGRGFVFCRACSISRIKSKYIWKVSSSIGLLGAQCMVRLFGLCGVQMIGGTYMYMYVTAFSVICSRLCR